MSDALSYEIVELIAAVLRDISENNGYRTDLGLNVLTELPQAEAKTMQTVIVATSFDFGEAARTKRPIAMNITIEVSVPASVADAQRRIHNAISDIQAAIPTIQRRLPNPQGSGGFVIAGTANVLQRPQGANSIVAQVPARATLVETINARAT